MREEETKYLLEILGEWEEKSTIKKEIGKRKWEKVRERSKRTYLPAISARF